MQVVSRRTGLTPATLRAWERRYHAVEPGRSEGHQRLYSDADVARLRLLRRLSLGGHRIGRIASLPIDELEALLAQEADARPPAAAPLPADSERLANELVAAVEGLRATTVRRLLERAASTHGVPALLEGLLRPLLQAVGDRWESGELQPAHEHLVTAEVRGLLERVLARHPPRPGAPVGIFTTPSGQRHELGALGCAVTAAVEGWAPLYLGADSPAADIVLAARETGARLVALSIAEHDVTEPFAEEVLAVARNLPGNAVLVVGGAGASRLADALAEAGARVPEDLEAFTQTLRSAAGRPESAGGPDTATTEDS